MQLFLNLWLTLLAIVATECSSQFNKAKQGHKPQLLSNNDLRYLASLSDTRHFNRALDKIMVPRVVGTEDHDKVFDYIVEELTRSGWHLEIDEFTDETPVFGPLTFRNVVARLNPDAERYLVLACHYDSKYFENELFVGATDSAVPCAMLLNLIRTLSNELKEALYDDVSLKLVFFDGEEAFKEWGPTDSIYGARHLARKWETNRTLSRTTGEEVSHLQRIDVLVLLDLIGAKNPNFYSYYPDTQKWFLRLADIEDRVDQMGLLKGHGRSYFKKTRPYGAVEDDHTPFLRRNVPVLHLITTPFPPEWHTPRDNREIVDEATVNNVNLILRVFLVKYLHLNLVSYTTSGASTPEKEL